MRRCTWSRWSFRPRPWSGSVHRSSVAPAPAEVDRFCCSTALTTVGFHHRLLHSATATGPAWSRPYTASVTTTGQRLGVLGGTFDPPHAGHLVAAVNVRHELDLDRVLLVVANDPWQKSAHRPVTPAADRLAMVEALVRDIDGLEASSIEIDRGGASYMVDTLAELAASDPAGRRFLIVGSDAAAGLTTWNRFHELPTLATLVLVDRPGIGTTMPPEGWEFERVAIPRLDISSTDLRERAADGRPLEGLVPAPVISVIRERRLYRGAP